MSIPASTLELPRPRFRLRPIRVAEFSMLLLFAVVTGLPLAVSAYRQLQFSAARASGRVWI